VHVAQQGGRPVVTGDPAPLPAIDAGIEVELLPWPGSAWHPNVVRNMSY
jgi:hypothetical protein